MEKGTFLNIKGTTGRAESVKVFFRGLSVKSILLAIRYFCNSYITEEKIKDLENLLYLCYLGELLRIDCGTLCFQESERDLRCVGLIGKKILTKG